MHNIQDNINLRSTSELDLISSKLSKNLISNDSNLLKLIDYSITLLEVLSYEVVQFNWFGNCDIELAYVTLLVISDLYKTCEESDNQKAKELALSIKATLHKKSTETEKIKGLLRKTENSTSYEVSSSDPLIQRLSKLRPSNGAHHGSLDNASNHEIFGALKYSDSISANRLFKLLYESPYKILLIDFRPAKDFEHNHIKHTDIINIEPSAIKSQIEAGSITDDQDLEGVLKTCLSETHHKRFVNRHKYDSIIFYNFRFGSKGSEPNKFECLAKSLIDKNKDGIPSSNPFRSVMELISFKNRYISSKLKMFPCYLNGGVYNWFEIFGDDYLEKSIKNTSITRPQASVSRDSLDKYYSPLSKTKKPEDSAINSPYLRNFGDYLSTAKTTSNTPVSNPFVPSDFTKANGSHDVGTANTKSTYSVDKLSKKGSVSNRSAYASTSSHPSVVDNTSNIPSQSVSKTKSKSKVDPAKFLEQYTTGLENLGNSCYMNCVLQCLGATPQLTKFFFPSLSDTSSSASVVQSYRQHINVNNTLGSKGILTTNFVKLLLNMFNNSGKYFSPSNFKKVVGSLSPNKQFASYDQQDCIEFLNFLLDGLHEDLNQMVVSSSLEKKAVTELTPDQEKTRELLPIRLASTIEWERYLKLNFSIVVDFFQGQYLSHLKCLECRTSSTTYNAFSMLSLPIPETFSSNRKVSLIDCLNEFTATELLDDNNKWFCPECKRFTKSTKKISITRLPQVLIVHFKRFKMNPNGYFNKLDTFVTYPVNEVLDLTSYWPDFGSTVEKEMHNPQLLSIEKEKEILSTLPVRNQQPPFRYKLYGVANHYGNLTTGHYTAYVYKKNEGSKTKGWCYFDDSKVTFNCKESQVLNQNAYCLFYQRIN